MIKREIWEAGKAVSVRRFLRNALLKECLRYYSKVWVNLVRKVDKNIYIVDENLACGPRGGEARFFWAKNRYVIVGWSLRESQNKVRSTISYNIVAPYHVYTPTASYIYEKPLFHMWPRPFLTIMRLKRAFQCWPKGQHMLTKISELKKECLSSL